MGSVTVSTTENSSAVCETVMLTDVVAPSIPVSPEENASSLGYCSSCRRVMRSSICALHSDQQILHSEDVVYLKRQDARLLAESCEKLRSSIVQCADTVSAMAQELEYNKSSALLKVEQTFEHAMIMLQERKDCTLAELQKASELKKENYSNKLNDLSFKLHQLDGLQTSIKEAEAACHLGNVMETDNTLSCFQTKLSNLGTQATGIQENCHLDFLGANESEIRRVMGHLGSVVISEVSTDLSTASGEGLKRCAVGQPTVVHVILRNKDGAIVQENCLEALIYKENLSVQPQISLNEHGSYDVVYIVPEAGSYTLSIGLFKQQIRNSPFKVKAVGKSKSSKNVGYVISVRSKPMTSASDGKLDDRPKTGKRNASCKALPDRSDESGKTSSGSPAAWSDLVNVIGCRGRGVGEFSNPQGVCVNRDDSIVVADSSNQSLQVFSRAGRLVRRLAEKGRIGGQLLRPTGVAITRLGSYVVADYENKCVNVYSAEWKFLKRIGHGKLLGPKGVSTTAMGEIVVADNKANAVIVFSSAGKVLRRLGEGASAGAKEWQLAGPHYVASTSEGDVLVTDFHSHSVKCYDKDGKFLWSFGSNGSGNGQFDGPTGIAIDDRGNILVADWGNSRVQVFDRNGSFVSHVNTEGSSLFGPQDLALFSDNTVVVSDSGNHCVKLFKYL